MRSHRRLRTGSRAIGRRQGRPMTTGERATIGYIGLGLMAPRQGHRRHAGPRQARSAVAQRRLPLDAARQRRALLGSGPARGERPHRRHHGAGGAAGARGDLPAHQGGAGRGTGAWGAAWQPERCRCPAPGWEGGAPLRAAIARNADRHAADLAPVVADIRACGHMGLGAIADKLNARGMLSRRGGRWHKSTVMNVLERLLASRSRAID